MSGIIFFGVLVAIAVFLVSIYNTLVRLRNEVKNSFAQIDVQLKRRYDLIPNLVETAKGFMAHERQTLEAVIQARNSAQALSQIAAKNPTGEPMQQFIGAENILSQAMGRLFALSEAYPDLKSNVTMNSMMEELAATENRISFARQAYNDSVMGYNNSREVFPNSLISNTYGFQPAIPFEVTKLEEKEPIKVQFT